MSRGLLLAFVLAVAGCRNPQGPTDPFLKEELPRLTKAFPAKLSPLPAVEPRPVRPPYANFYRAAIGALDKAAAAQADQRFAWLPTPAQREFVGLMRQGKLQGWQGPAQGFVYFVLRSDAVDVVYGTVEGYEALGIPYQPHIAPLKRG